jgi:hypothetical protein
VGKQEQRGHEGAPFTPFLHAYTHVGILSKVHSLLGAEEAAATDTTNTLVLI